MLFARERMQAEVLKIREQQLELANKELDSFNYTIAHDLRSPLRAISAFSHMLMKGHDDIFDADAKQELHTIRNNV